MLQEDYISDINRFLDPNRADDRAAGKAVEVSLARDVMLSLASGVARGGGMSIFQDDVRAVYTECGGEPASNPAPKRQRLVGGSAVGGEETWQIFLRSHLHGFLLPRRDVSSEGLLYYTHPQVLLDICTRTSTSGMHPR